MTPAQRGRPPRALAAFAATVALQLVLLYWPFAPGGGGLPHQDKAVHLLIFAAVAWTGLRAGVPARWLLPLLVLHAGVSELVQGGLLPDRSGDPADVLADLAGVLAGSVLARASWRDDRAVPTRPRH